MSGSRPIATNSVVPMANPPSASASTASQRTAGSGATTETDGVGRSSETVTWMPCEVRNDGPVVPFDGVGRGEPAATDAADVRQCQIAGDVRRR